LRIENNKRAIKYLRVLGGSFLLMVISFLLQSKIDVIGNIEIFQKVLTFEMVGVTLAQIFY